MRLVRKNLDDKPAILTDQRTLDLLEKLSREADPLQISESYYQDVYKDADGRIQSRVRDKLNEYYFQKCAYCETYCKAEIEHYRPKKAVKGEVNGYYWLCYEWSNLVPSCHDCNTAGGKGNQFPVSGIRVSKPSFGTDGKLNKAKSLAHSDELSGEKPYLLHPEIDEPLEFLGVIIDPSGEGLRLTGIDGVHQRGEQTIRICNLNRKDLKLKRLQIVDDFINSINAMFALLVENVLSPEKLRDALQICFRQMDANKVNSTFEHTLLRRFVMLNAVNFNTVILPRLESGQRVIVQEAFNEYYLSRPAIDQVE
ncbi:hypothetical protein ACS5NO_03960 [Larkinella sp. GY13]|uniref:hypothetical protein n=1 Tax=Larkinella sp. GY13 TaxID=3453720 RepID=UPI003EF0036A